MICVTKVEDVPAPYQRFLVRGGKHRGIVFPEHALAHRLLDGLKGIELGAASHNPFGLDSINVAPEEGHEFYVDSQVDMCGTFAEVDLFAEANELRDRFEHDSQDYIISSHVLEHIPNIFGALKVWNTVVRDGGYIYMIVPQRDALPSDAGRELTTYEELWEAYEQGFTPVTLSAVKPEIERRGHYWVFTADSLETIIGRFCQEFGVKWELVAKEERDTKVGNGFTLVYKVNKPAPAPEKPAVAVVQDERVTAAEVPVVPIDESVVTDAPVATTALDAETTAYLDEVISTADQRPVKVKKPKAK